MEESLQREITQAIVKELSNHPLLTPSTTATLVPVGVSARHLHLQEEHLRKLFGYNGKLTKYKDISQPGQYACNEKVTLKGPKGIIENVRVLGPLRSQTQVEVSLSDARKLGLSPPVRNSGNLIGSSPITVIGPKGTVYMKEGCIVADRHIHMTPKDAIEYGVVDQQNVAVFVEGSKGGIMNNVTIRVKESYALDMHIDTDDANAFGLKGNEQVRIVPFPAFGGL